MIKSQKQLMAAQQKLQMLKMSLSQPVAPGVAEVVADAARGQVQELIEEIAAEIEEYKELRARRRKVILIHSLEDLMKAPIFYRLASNMTIEEFARKVNVHSRQIARYEAESYHNATTDTLLKILTSLKVRISGKISPEKLDS